MGNSCSVLSVYENQLTNSKNTLENMKKRVVINAEPKKSVRVLLLGTAEAGKSTILKQMKLLKLKGFNEVEINGFIATIRDNVVSAMRILLKSMATLDIPFADNERCEAVQNFLVLSNTLRNSPEDLDLETMRLILDDFLQDQGVQACLSRRHEYHLPDSSQYFLTRVNEVMKDNYKPTDEDIIRARRITVGFESVSFNQKNLAIQLIDVGGQRPERRSWIHVFNDVAAVIFIASLIEYDMVLEEDDTTNRMEESLNLFKKICFHYHLTEAGHILFLNKTDLLPDKLEQSPFSKHFADFIGPEDYSTVCNYIRQRYEAITYEEIGRYNDNQVALYTHFTCATDRENVAFVFNCVEDIIIQQNMWSTGMK